jgi:hypothetical protein
MGWQSCKMNTPAITTTYKTHRFPAEIISHAVWLYFRFSFSFRAVEEFLLGRGVVVTYEAIRKWGRKFGQRYANQPFIPTIAQALNRRGEFKLATFEELEVMSSPFAQRRTDVHVSYKWEQRLFRTF